LGFSRLRLAAITELGMEECHKACIEHLVESGSVELRPVHANPWIAARLTR
jgi:hypothetical protein